VLHITKYVHIFSLNCKVSILAFLRNWDNTSNNYSVHI